MHEYIVIGLLVGFAALYLVRRFWNTHKRGACCGCSNCSGCAGNSE